MSYITDDGKHEGWDAAEFPDGRVSTSLSAEGVHVQTPQDAIGYFGGKYPADVVDGRTAIGWRGMCTCGWLGPLWRRVPTPGQHDLARRQVHHDPGNWGTAPPEVEDAIHTEWKAHLPHPTLADVAAAAEDARKAEARLGEAVNRARAAGQTWEAIGNAAGITKESASERWRKR
jgi:hypothetical protein